jgi:predicted HTH transcriptional regulator
VYVRVGSTNRHADAELIEELRRFSRGEGFDEQPLPGLGSEDLGFRAASESFAALRALHHPDLESLRLVGDHQGKTVPTVGGMILFGHDRERHFPDAWIQAGRFLAVPARPLRSPVAQSIRSIHGMRSKHD